MLCTQSSAKIGRFHNVGAIRLADQGVLSRLRYTLKAARFQKGMFVSLWFLTSVEMSTLGYLCAYDEPQLALSKARAT